MVGDREQIAADVADALLARLHAGGLSLHQAMALPLDVAARERIEVALQEIDAAISVIRRAAVGLGPDGKRGPSP